MQTLPPLVTGLTVGTYHSICLHRTLEQARASSERIDRRVLELVAGGRGASQEK